MLTALHACCPAACCASLLHLGCCEIFAYILQPDSTVGSHHTFFYVLAILSHFCLCRHDLRPVGKSKAAAAAASMTTISPFSPSLPSVVARTFLLPVVRRKIS